MGPCKDTGRGPFGNNEALSTWQFVCCRYGSTEPHNPHSCMFIVQTISVNCILMFCILKGHFSSYLASTQKYHSNQVCVPGCAFSIHTLSGPATAIFPIVLAPETLLHGEIQNADCQNAGPCVSSRLPYVLMVSKGGQKENHRNHPGLCLWFLQGIGSAKCCRVQRHREKYGLRGWTTVGCNPGFATFSLWDLGQLLGRTTWNWWQLTIFTHSMEISHSST